MIDVFAAPLVFKACDSGDRLDEQTCTSKWDARSHAGHLAAEYGCDVDIYRDGKLLTTVREY